MPSGSMSASAGGNGSPAEEEWGFKVEEEGETTSTFMAVAAEYNTYPFPAADLRRELFVSGPCSEGSTRQSSSGEPGNVIGVMVRRRMFASVAVSIMYTFMSESSSCRTISSIRLS